jgi:hypothetical protein
MVWGRASEKKWEAHFVIGLNVKLNLLPRQGADSSKRSVPVVNRFCTLGLTHLINILFEGSDAGRCQCICKRRNYV